MTEEMKTLLVIAYARGYQAGHEHTVEGYWRDDPQRVEEAIADMLEDGTFSQ